MTMLGFEVGGCEVVSLGIDALLYLLVSGSDVHLFAY